MKKKRIFKMLIVSMSFAFVFLLLVLSLKEKSMSDLNFFEIAEMMVGIPLLAVIFYWLFSEKLDDFEKRLDVIDVNFNKILRQLHSEETQLTGEEKTLRDEIRELREVVDRMDADIGYISKKVKK